MCARNGSARSTEDSVASGLGLEWTPFTAKLSLQANFQRKTALRQGWSKLGQALVERRGHLARHLEWTPFTAKLSLQANFKATDPCLTQSHAQNQVWLGQRAFFGVMAAPSVTQLSGAGVLLRELRDAYRGLWCLVGVHGLAEVGLGHRGLPSALRPDADLPKRRLRSGLTYTVLSDFKLIHESYECVSIKCCNILFAVIYRPPSGSVSDFFHFIETLLEECISRKIQNVLVGDFNMQASVENSHILLSKNYTSHLAASTLLLPQ